jgi:MFS transporter, AAHS family, 4-hydroxybenzoate transporter
LNNFDRGGKRFVARGPGRKPGASTGGDKMASAAINTSDSDRAGVVDVADFIDRQPVVRFQIRLLLLCAAVLFIDGFDTQAIGYVAPDLARDWSLPRGALGPVFSAGLFGLMIGALILGPVADRIGRKRIIVLSTLAFGIGTLTTILAQDVYWLIGIRFLTGLGLGGAMPNAVALTSEFSPHRRRATMVMTMFVGFSVGAALGGLLAAALIPAFGWRSIFLVGGIAPVLLVPVLAKLLPESIRFLALTGRDDARVANMLTQISPSTSFAAGTRFGVHEPKLSGLPVAHLFAESRAWTTLLFWIVFFMSLLDLYLLSNWLPTVLNDLGASMSMAAAIGAMLQVGGVIGVFTLGKFIDRFSFRALALTYLLASVAITAIGFSSHSIGLATIAIFCAGFCIVGGQTASNALTATYYPTMMRSTGVGWALGIGRIGSIVGPLIGGIMLSRHMGAETLFLAAAVPALVACAASLALSRTASRGMSSASCRPAHG